MLRTTIFLLVILPFPAFCEDIPDAAPIKLEQFCKTIQAIVKKERPRGTAFETKAAWENIGLTLSQLHPLVTWTDRITKVEWKDGLATLHVKRSLGPTRPALLFSSLRRPSLVVPMTAADAAKLRRGTKAKVTAQLMARPIMFAYQYPKQSELTALTVCTDSTSHVPIACFLTEDYKVELPGREPFVQKAKSPAPAN